MRRIIVVGGGIGGLAATIGLLRTGSEVLVLEQSDRFAAIGAGVQLAPNAMRALIQLGLADEVYRSGVRPVAGHLLRWDNGDFLAGGPMAEVERRYGTSFCAMYRPDLIGILAAQIPTGTVRFGARVVGVDAGDGVRARVRLADGTVEVADLVVGADGVHSVVRPETVGESPSRFCGCSAYRTIVPGDDVAHPGGPMIRLWLGPDRHVVAYHTGRDARYFNLVGIVPDPDMCSEFASCAGDHDDLRAHFDGWDPALRELFDVAEGPVLRTPLHDRLPLPTWSTTTTTLIGDAAHPMLPFIAQGAGQALEDAAALTLCLTETPGDIAFALSRYEAIRRPQATRVQKLSWRNTSTMHLPDGPEQRARDAEWARIEGGMISTLDWLYAGNLERAVMPNDHRTSD